ncbi:MAG: isochorismatase family protein, partial [Treponema sp.]|nr:isochorismatase family protein [Treponema sp.]
ESVQDFGKQYPQLADSVPAATQQFLWPDHCIQQSQGARFHSDFDPFCIDYVFRKGYHKHIDSYSAFFENDRCTPTDLPDYLKDRGVKTVILAGLATDYCVFYSAVDSTRLGYETHVVIDASAAVDSPPNSLEQAIVTMKNSGVQFNGVKDFL